MRSAIPHRIRPRPSPNTPSTIHWMTRAGRRRLENSDWDSVAKSRTTLHDSFFSLRSFVHRPLDGGMGAYVVARQFRDHVESTSTSSTHEAIVRRITIVTSCGQIEHAEHSFVLFGFDLFNLFEIFVHFRPLRHIRESNPSQLLDRQPATAGRIMWRYRCVGASPHAS